MDPPAWIKYITFRTEATIGEDWGFAVFEPKYIYGRGGGGGGGDLAPALGEVSSCLPAPLVFQNFLSIRDQMTCRYSMIKHVNPMIVVGFFILWHLHYVSG